MNAQLTPLHIQGRVGQILESTLGSVISTGTYAWNTWVMANETSDAQLYPQEDTRTLLLGGPHRALGSLVQARLNVTGAIAATCLLFVSTFLVTYVKSSIAFHRKGGQKYPIPIPYWIPFLGNLIPFLWDPAGFCSWTTSVYGFSTPVQVKLGPMKLCLVAGADQLAALFKASKNMSTKSGVLLALENIFGTPSDVIPFYAADDSGVKAVSAPGSQVKPEHRLNFYQVRAAHKHLAGNALVEMTERFLSVLRQRIRDSRFHEEWTEMPDLYTFLQYEMLNAAVEALCGKYLLTQYPGFVDDFWEFDRSIPTLFRGTPRWLAPRPYRVRQRLLNAVKSWHKLAREHSDFTKIGPEDEEWDPYWGSKLMRARQEYTSGMHFMNADALAAEDLGLLSAMNTNAVPAIGWFIIEFCRDASLLSRGRAEVETARIPSPADGKPEFDISKLCSLPLLQSVYAETLRLRVALIVTRTPEHEDFHFDEWVFPESRIIALSSRSAAMNPAIWNVGTPSDPHPLDQFWADRFLVYDNDPGSGPSRKDISTIPKTQRKWDPESGSEEAPRFSMNNVAGGWIPYGGGERICPGRHFAKQEIISSFAMLFTHYDIELLTPDDWVPRPDMRFFPFGGLPPVGKIPFRIRRRRT